MKKNVAIILGTRPEAIKLIPVYLAMKKSMSFFPFLISTGQHKEMLDSVFTLFNICPDVELDVMTENQNLTSLASCLFNELGGVIQKNNFDLILVQGDTTTALVGGIVGHYNKIKVGHIEAGLRTYDKWSPYPEECNRKMLSAVADYHFSPTKTATNALLKEGVNKGVYQVGNTVIDSLLVIKEKVINKINYYEKIYDYLPKKPDSIILVTGHRRESFGEGFRNICKALSQIASESPDKVIIYPVHLNPNVRKTVNKYLNCYDNIYLIDPVPYDEMVYLMWRSWLIMTDSGGIQEEAPSLNKPVIVMRETTERLEGVQSGCSVLSGVEALGICENFNDINESKTLYQKMAFSKNPYGNGKSSEIIVSILQEIINVDLGGLNSEGATNT